MSTTLNNDVKTVSLPAVPGDGQCRNCGAVLEGRFCHQCGEKRFDPHERTVAHLFHEAFHFITHFDGSVLRTLRTVATRPGQLSLDYCAGIRKKYFKPVSLLLLLIVVYLLFPRFQGLNMRLQALHQPRYGFASVSVPLTNSKMQHRHWNYKQMLEHYDAKSPAISKVALFAILPVCAAFLSLLFFYRKERYFYDHIILATEIMIFFVAFNFLIIPFLSFLTEKIYPPGLWWFSDEAGWREVVESVAAAVFIVAAFSRFYGQRWWKTVPQGLLFVIFFMVVAISIYRCVVLLVTMALI